MRVKQERLVSLDVLRGFTMFWIIGGAQLIRALAKATQWPVFKILAKQMAHAPWNGFRFFDLIFPLFMFISGVSIPISIDKSLQKGKSKQEILKKVCKRVLTLIVLGIIYNNKFSFDVVNMRFASVLGQIGIAYFIAVIAYLYTNTKGQIIWVITTLLLFWVAMIYIPVPNYGAGVLTPEGNLSGFIDRLLLPGRLSKKIYDPQGVILMVSSSAITLSGALTGIFLWKSTNSPSQKVMIMILSGIVLIGISLIWNIYYPINKEIWSSSFNVITIGISLMLLAIFYYILDIKNFQKWSFPFKLIGLNAITIYLANKIINFNHTSEFFLTGFMHTFPDYSRVILLIGVITLKLYFLYFLYRKKIFLKV